MLDKIKNLYQKFADSVRKKLRKGFDKEKIKAYFSSSRNLFVIKAGALAIGMIVIAGAGYAIDRANITDKDTQTVLKADTEASKDSQSEAISSEQHLQGDLALYLDEGKNRSGNTEVLAKSRETSKSSTKESTKESTTKQTTSETTKSTTTTKKTETSQPKTVTVEQGEGWYHLGERTSVDFRYLAVFNGKHWNEPVYTGQTYKVPSPEELANIELPKETTPATQAPTTAATQAQATTASPETTAAPAQTSSGSPYIYSLSDLTFHGRIYWADKEFTFYSQSVLPGAGLDIPGRHVSADGYVVDGDGYIVLASDYYANGTVIDTPFGAPGKVYDRFGGGNPAYRFDVYIR